MNIEQTLGLPPAIQLGIALNIIAVVIRRIPKVTNWMIPVACVVLGSVIYPQITTPANTVFSGAEKWMMYLQGLMIGFSSLGLDSLAAKTNAYKSFTGSFGDAYTQGKSMDAPKSELKDTPKD